MLHWCANAHDLFVDLLDHQSLHIEFQVSAQGACVLVLHVYINLEITLSSKHCVSVVSQVVVQPAYI